MIWNLRVVLLIFVGLAVSSFSFFSNLTDDAYIHARIVDNFFNYGTFSYNLGDTFKASSSTGYIALIAVLNIVVSDPIIAIRVLNFLALLIYFAFLHKLMVQSTSAISKLSLMISLPFVIASSFGGMETTLSVIAVLIATSFLYNKRYGVALTFTCIAVLVRVEFFLLLSLLAMYVLIIRGFKKRYLLSFLPLLGLLLTDFMFYENFIPHAASVKSIAYNHPLLNSFINAFSLSSGPYWLILLLPIYFLFICLLWSLFTNILKKRHFALKPYVIYGVFSLGILLMWSLGRSNIFPWYLPIVALGFSLTIYFYFDESTNGIDTKTYNSNWFRYVSMLAAVSIFIISINGFLKLYAWNTPLKFTANERVSNYLRISSYLYKFCADCTLMTSEIGGLGYGFKGKVLDGFGLGDPEAVKYHPMRVPEQRQSYGIGAIPLGYARERKPDFIVSMPIFTMEYRNSELHSRSHNYFCPFRNNSSLWGNTGIAIHSSVILPDELLDNMLCKKVSSNY